MEVSTEFFAELGKVDQFEVLIARLNGLRSRFSDAEKLARCGRQAGQNFLFRPTPPELVIHTTLPLAQNADHSRKVVSSAELMAASWPWRVLSK
jgi:hypothetical protein